MKIKIKDVKLILISAALFIASVATCIGGSNQVHFDDFPLDADIDSLEVKLNTLDTQSEDFLHTLIHFVIIKEIIYFSTQSENVDQVSKLVENNKSHYKYSNIADYLVASRYQDTDEYRSYKLLLPVLQKFRHNKDTLGIFNTLNILVNLDLKIGSESNKDGEFDTYLYQDEAFAISKQYSDPYLRLKSYSIYFYNFQDIVLSQDSIDKYLVDAGEIIRQHPSYEYMYFNLYTNLGEYYKGLSQFEKSDSFYEKSLTVAYDYYRQLALFNYGSTFNQSHNHNIDSSIYYLETAFEIDSIQAFKSLEYDLAKSLSQLYYEKGDYQTAKFYDLKQDSIGELMVSLQNEKSILQIQTKNKLDQQNEKTLLLIAQKRNLIIGMILLVLIIVLLLYAVKSTIDIKNIEKREMEFKEQLNTIIIHDLKSPFIAMDRLVENQSISKQDYETLSGYVKNGHRLVNDLLIWSKLKLNKGLGETKKVNVYECLLMISSGYMASMKEKNIKLNLNVDPDLYCTLKCESVKLIISNLLSNSIKHSEASEITIFTEIRNNRIVINLSDNGVGIPSYMESNIRKILYEQNNDVVRSGLGFSIIKSLVKLANAKLEFTTSNTGSSFTLQLNA